MLGAKKKMIYTAARAADDQLVSASRESVKAASRRRQIGCSPDKGCWSGSRDEDSKGGSLSRSSSMCWMQICYWTSNMQCIAIQDSTSGGDWMASCGNSDTTYLVRSILGVQLMLYGPAHDVRQVNNDESKAPSSRLEGAFSSSAAVTRVVSYRGPLGPFASILRRIFRRCQAGSSGTSSMF